MSRLVTVGLDGSPESLAAAGWAAQDAEARGATLCLLHAWILLDAERATGAGVPEHDHWAKKTVDDAARAVAERHPRLPVTAQLVAEEPETALLDAAKESELLVLGSQGLGPLASYLFGAVALHLVAHSPAPAVLVRAGRAGWDEAGAPAPGGQDVVVGVPLGGAGDSADVLDFAFETAHRHGTGLRAVYARRLPPYPYREQDGPLAPEIAEETRVNAEEEVAGEARRDLNAALAPCREKYPGVHAVTRVRAESPARALVHECDDAGLLVVGRRREQPALRPRLGHVVQAAAHHAPCPVAVVPHG